MTTSFPSPNKTIRAARVYYRARTIYRRLRAFLGRGWLCQRTRIVVQSAEQACDNPIFVVGTHRSGTSLMRRLLDSHRNIACPPESFWLRHYTPLLNDPLTFDGLWNLGFDRPAAIQGLRTGASYFHEAYRRAKGKKRWADKTPQYVRHLETLVTLFGSNARFVMIVRHPMDVAFSNWQRGWTFVATTGDLVTDVCNYVLESGYKQLSFLEAHPRLCHAVDYDRLVTRPEVTLRELCKFLNEPWDANMLRHHQLPHDFGCEDPIARGTSGFNASFENWKQWPSETIEQARSILEPLMRRLGYSIDSAMRAELEPCGVDNNGY